MLTRDTQLEQLCSVTTESPSHWAVTDLDGAGNVEMGEALDPFQTLQKGIKNSNIDQVQEPFLYCLVELRKRWPRGTKKVRLVPSLQRLENV